MSFESSCKKISEPTYYHREYKNDVGEKAEEPSWARQCQRVATVSLPFFSLYKPLSLPISLGMGALRACSSIHQLFTSVQQGHGQDIPYQLLQTTIAVMALGGTIFAHPAGMLVTTVQDIIIETIGLIGCLQRGKHQKALVSCANIINNALYLALFTHGGVELAIASFAMQIMLGLHHSHGEFQKGNFLEGAGHVLMAMVRGNQMVGQVQLLETKWKIDGLLKQAGANGAIVGSVLIPIVSPMNARSNALTVSDLNQINAKAPDVQDNNAWFNAVKSGEMHKIQEFIRAGIDVNTCELINGYPYYTALMYASEMGRIDIVRTLLDAGANVNQVTFSKKCALTSALCHPRILECLIEAGADVNIKLAQRQTPLHYAAQGENTFESLCILIDNGANVNAKDLYDRTPLHGSMYYKKNALALLDNGADLHALDDKDWKPLHYAYKWGNLELLNELAKRKVSLNEFTPDGKNALHHSLDAGLITYQERLKLLKWLVDDQKMNVNTSARWFNGKDGALTPLMLALNLHPPGDDENFEIAEFFLARGANINFKIHHNGRPLEGTVLDWARKHKYHRYVIEWLIQHGAKSQNELK